MQVINGVYTSANIFTDNVETYALAQIQFLCNQQVFQGCKVRVMPDIPSGQGRNDWIYLDHTGNEYAYHGGN